MASNTAGSVARQLEVPLVHYLRKQITFADDAVETEVGWIPAGAVVIDGYIAVSTAFNDSGTDVIDVGTDADPDGFATVVDVSAVGIKPFDVLSTSDDATPSVDTKITATYTGQNSDSTAGVAEVVVLFVVDNDR